MFFVMEIIGTIAFAISGAMVAIENKMDIFGMCTLGLTTAVGGGIIRDLILGINPPIAFQLPIYATVAIISSIAVFPAFVRRILFAKQKIYDITMLVTDAIGLGTFTVIGLRAGLNAFPEAHYFMAVFVGMMTGVGGGALRDMFADVTPEIFVKKVYASASMAGALVCIALWDFAGEGISMVAGLTLVVIIRMLAAYFEWSLPKPKPIE